MKYIVAHVCMTEVEARLDCRSPVPLGVDDDFSLAIDRQFKGHIPWSDSKGQRINLSSHGVVKRPVSVDGS